MIENRLNEDDKLRDLFKLIVTDSDFDEFFTCEFQKDARALDDFLTENVSIDVYYEYEADIRASVTFCSSEKLDDEEIAEKIVGGFAEFTQYPDIESADFIVRTKLNFMNESVELISERELDIAA